MHKCTCNCKLQYKSWKQKKRQLLLGASDLQTCIRLADGWCNAPLHLALKMVVAWRFGDVSLEIRWISNPQPLGQRNGRKVDRLRSVLSAVRVLNFKPPGCSHISPSNTALSSMEQVKAYLQTQGTCKCGLECPLQCDSVFSFDAKVASKPWSPVDFQDSSVGEFNKLCNHKRKHMTMLGFDPENPLDPKRLDGPDFRKKRKVYGGAYSNSSGPRKPRVPKDASPPVVAAPWNDSAPQQPPPPVLPTPSVPPSAEPPVISQQSAGPRMFPRMMTPQQQFMQQQLEQQRIFRYQQSQMPQQLSQQQSQMPQQLSQQRIYQGTPPMMGPEMYACAKEANPSQQGEESQTHIPSSQGLQMASSQGLQVASSQGLQVASSQGLQVASSQGLQMASSQQEMEQEQNQQMHMQMQAMQQAQMQAAQQMQQQQAVQNQQMHQQGLPSQQPLQQISSDHANPLQQNLPQQPVHLQQQLQMQQLGQQSSQQLQVQQQMQMQAQLAQMQQMQQQYQRQNQSHPSQQSADQYQTEPQNQSSNQVTSEPPHYTKFPNQASNVQDQKLSVLPQQQHYRQPTYPPRTPYESFPPHVTQGSYPPDAACNYEPICDSPYQNNTNQSTGSSIPPGIQTTPAGLSNTYHVPQPQPVFNYQRQTPEQPQTNVQAVQPTQRPTPPWQQNSRPTTPSNPTPPSPYERVPPLHPSNVQNTISPAGYNPVPEPIPVTKKRTKTAKSPNKKQSTEPARQDPNPPSYPSFMDDPSGYLAQQTALLNSTISKQCDIRVSSDMLENKNLHRISRRYQTETSTSQARTPDSSVRNETSESTVERIKTPHAELKGPIQGGTVSTSNRSPGGILVAPDASSPRSTSSMNSNNSPQPYSTPSSPGGKSPERQARSMPIASGHTVSSNTITSVLAGRSNTSLTPSVASPPQPEVHIPVTLPAKSPLEMVQSVVSSIQLPQVPQQTKSPSVSLGDIKVSTSLPSHILVSSNGQLIVATQPQSNKSSPSLVTVNTSSASSSSLMTNVTGAISQVIPSLGINQQVLGQPTVLVNTLQAPLLFQPNIMTVDNLNSVQIPHLTVSNPMSSDSGAFSPRSSQGMISPESAKRKALKANKQRKVSPQKLTSMLLTPQQGSSSGTGTVVVQPQQSFAQPMLQTLILPNKGNFNNQLIATAIQPLNLVQQFPTIQQFLVPAGLGGMAVMSQDGTATLLQDAVQLNVLTPVQTSGMFGGQSILTSPNSMVIRSPNAGGNARPNTSAAQGQFITTNSQNQLIVNNPFTSQLQGQLSPIITNLSPNNQQISFTSPTSQRQTQQEYIQCGQTLIPITSQQSNNTSTASNNQNTTVLQQNALIQQQMSLLQQANQEQTSQNFIINETGSKTPNFIINDASSKTQNFIITTSDKQQGSTNYILSPKSEAKSPGSQTHFILNTSDSKTSGQSFIITSPNESKQILTSGNFILTSDKTNSGNLILSTAPQQQIQQQDKTKLLQQAQQQQIQQITQQQLQQLQQNSQQLQQQQLQQLQQSQQLQTTQQLQQLQNRLNMSTQTSVNPTQTSSSNQMIQASPITIYVSQTPSTSSLSSNLYTSTSSGNVFTSSSIGQSNFTPSSSGSNVYTSNPSGTSSVYTTISSSATNSVYTISSTAPSSVYTSSPPDTTTLSPIEAGGAPSPCHSLEVPPSPLLPDDNHPSPTSTSVHLVSSSNTDWSDVNPDSDGFVTPKPSGVPPSSSTTTFVKSSSKDFVESSSSPPTHRSYGRSHHHSHHHRSHSHHHHQSQSKHHHSKPTREHHDYSHRSDSSRHHSSHVTNIRPDEGSDSDHSADSDDDSAVATTTKLLGLAEGDLVWGSVKGYPSWPGKLISPAPTQGRVWVKWFGMSNEPLSEVEPATLKSLSQGLEAHHRSRKKLRKSRKLNTQLENAIQEAMAELDRMSETPQQSRPLPPAVAASGGKSKR
ncbi:hypothetical protein M8J76_008787 [Diaphorina citri]|nr:hypothetical protein M8J76_008787 [Diaphorina citri]